MKLRVLYHGHCFDGVASAATFTRFYLERIDANTKVSYGGLLHRPNNLLFDRDMFDGDENAIVDFKYSPSEKLTWWFDHHQSAFLTTEVAASDEVQRRFQPILKLHRETLDAIKRKATCENDVVQFDLIEEGFEGFNKFIPYYLFPEATYTVALTRAPQRTKISVGSNPWAPRPRRHNIATICERYGGGGHAVVGAISFAPNEIEEARKAMAEIVEELSN